MTAKPFFEVLKDQIRSELRKELESEWALKSSQAAGPKPAKVRSSPWLSAESSLQSWLNAKVEKSEFGVTDRAKRAYKSPQDSSVTTCKKPDPVTSEPLAHATSPEAAFAVEILSRFSGTKLPDSFTMNELKTVWRRAALKTHPDRVAQSDLISQARATALFRELSEAHELLEELFSETQCNFL
jgi:hypothetical protein